MQTAQREVLRIGPQPGPQEQFLSTSADIAIFGGQAGGGKSFGLILDPLRHYDVPGFGAVIFRRTVTQVRAEGGLWDTSRKIYPYAGGVPRESVPAWRFPAYGTAVSFAHLEHEGSVQNWQGPQIPMIGFDELVHFSESQFWYMLSRNRSTCGVRPYIRATTNPDPDSWVAPFIGWWWDQETGFPIPERSGVIRWFVRASNSLVWADTREELKAGYPDLDPKSVTFIISRLEDNPALMAADPGYKANLMALPFVEQQRLLHGNWRVRSFVDGATLRPDTIDRHRLHHSTEEELAELFSGLVRVVIAIDPAVSAGPLSNETGLAAVGRLSSGQCIVLEDRSGIYKADEWGRIALEMYDKWFADAVIGEVNNGGDLVEANLKACAEGRPINFEAVRASRGKHVRADPVLTLYNRGLMLHLGTFPRAEAQLCGFTRLGYEGDGSPDRAEAIIWGATKLMLGDPEPVSAVWHGP